jgi:cytosine/adenosine deaminase-related metal-dependent hydrolase
MFSLHVKHGTIVTPTPGGGVAVLEDHDILIDNGVIRHVLPAGQADAQLQGGVGGESIDARHYLVVPGLVNTHHHLYQSLTRGLRAAQDAPLFDWLTALYGRWRRLDYETVKLASAVSMAELLLSGCTTTSDHFYVFPRGSDVRLEAVLDAAEITGLRIHACRGSMSLGRSAGGLPPDDCVESEADILADCRRVVELFHDPDPYAMRRIDLAPCSPFSVSTELMRETARLARELGVLLHTHAAENVQDEQYCLEKFGVRPVRYLQDTEWLGADVYLAHCVHLSDEEIRLLAETRTGVSHCPCSNMRLASGVAPVRRLLDAGAKVGIGVDGSSSNDAGNVLAEARQALLLQRVGGDASGLRVREAFRLATLGGAEVLGRDKLGRIEPGAAADLAMFRRDDVALAGAVAQDPVAALVLCQAPRADRVLVGGRTVVRDGRAVGFDERELAEKLNELVARSFR